MRFRYCEYCCLAMSTFSRFSELCLDIRRVQCGYGLLRTLLVSRSMGGTPCDCRMLCKSPTDLPSRRGRLFDDSLCSSRRGAAEFFAPILRLIIRCKGSRRTACNIHAAVLLKPHTLQALAVASHGAKAPRCQLWYCLPYSSYSLGNGHTEVVDAPMDAGL